MRSASGVQHVPSPNLLRRRIIGARVNIFVLGHHLGIGYFLRIGARNNSVAEGVGVRWKNGLAGEEEGKETAPAKITPALQANLLPVPI